MARVRTWTFYGGHDPEDYQHMVGGPTNRFKLTHQLFRLPFNFKQHFVSSCEEKEAEDLIEFYIFYDLNHNYFIQYFLLLLVY